MLFKLTLRARVSALMTGQAAWPWRSVTGGPPAGSSGALRSTTARSSIARGSYALNLTIPSAIGLGALRYIVR